MTTSTRRKATFRAVSGFGTVGGYAGAYVLAYVRRAASPLGVNGHYGALRGACFAVGASIARPRNNPPNMERADANSYPVGLRICIGVLYFFRFHRGRPMAAPTHGYAPVGRTVLVRMYVRTELFRNSYQFFSASICHLTVIRNPLRKTQINEKTQTFRAAGNPKGVRPFWSF